MIGMKIVNPLKKVKRLWCWERLSVGGEGGDRGWDDWMASLTQWTWVWGNSRRKWSPGMGKPGVLQPMGLWRVKDNLATGQQPQEKMRCFHPFFLQSFNVSGSRVWTLGCQELVTPAQSAVSLGCVHHPQVMGVREPFLSKRDLWDVYLHLAIKISSNNSLWRIGPISLILLWWT